jgi:hypothetical protein
VHGVPVAPHDGCVVVVVLDVVVVVEPPAWQLPLPPTTTQLFEQQSALLIHALPIAPQVVVGLHAAGNGLTNSGTASASRQSTAASVTQSTHATRSLAVAIGRAQLVWPGSGGVTAGQLATNPTAVGVRSPVPSHSLSGPPHALQIEATFFCSARAMADAVVASGHGVEVPAANCTFQHFCRAFDLAPRNLAVAFPIACWHLLTTFAVANAV